jgi:uncharacterized protein YjiS (DUF1127 family)
MHAARDFRLSGGGRRPETAFTGVRVATRPAKEKPVSTACLDARSESVVLAIRRRGRPAAAARPIAERGAGLSRLAVRMQWGPMPADAVRLQAEGVSDAFGDASSRSLAAWAAGVRREPRVRPALRRVAAALAGAVASFAIGAGAPLRAWRRERRIAAGITALRELDDRMLRDLGVERADIVRAARQGSPFRR